MIPEITSTTIIMVMMMMIVLQEKHYLGFFCSFFSGSLLVCARKATEKADALNSLIRASSVCYDMLNY